MAVSISHQDVFDCCSSQTFAQIVASRAPYPSLDALISEARSVWWNEVPAADWLQAFAAHPRIGDLDGLRKKFGAFADMSKGEQAAAAATATDLVLKELAECNKQYEAKFGHIFIICASGKTAPEMLAAIKARHANAPFSELGIAAGEQMKITELRLRAVLNGAAAPSSAPPPAAGGAAQRRTAPEPAKAASRSPITTHMLDIALGRPAEGVPVSLQRQEAEAGRWAQVAAGATNKDGRIGDLLPVSNYVQPGNYRVVFDTTTYMARCKTMHPTVFSDVPFYPKAVVYFTIAPWQAGEHFHVPLTWSPYGYSTYRGS